MSLGGFVTSYVCATVIRRPLGTVLLEDAVAARRRETRHEDHLARAGGDHSAMAAALLRRVSVGEVEGTFPENHRVPLRAEVVLQIHDRLAALCNTEDEHLVCAGWQRRFNRWGDGVALDCLWRRVHHDRRGHARRADGHVVPQHRGLALLRLKVGEERICSDFREGHRDAELPGGRARIRMEMLELAQVVSNHDEVHELFVRDFEALHRYAGTLDGEGDRGLPFRREIRDVTLDRKRVRRRFPRDLVPE